jgi:4-hydroxy-3-polyprenylbenzoate decarboxylase
VVITKDPETGIYNAGTYRMQVFDDETAGMHWQRQKQGYNHMLKAKKMGKNLDVAVVIGVHPAIFFSSISPLPEGINEMAFAGYLMGEKTRLVKGETVDLYYPADAEIVLEGYVDPIETKIEGPFGDHTGYYSPPEEYPVFHIKRISAREDFIYHATVVGKFWNEDVLMGHAIEKIFLPAIKLLIPDIVDIFLPEEGVLNDIAIVSIDKKYPGQGIKVGMAVLSQGQLMFNKYVIVVDKDINVRDKSEVLWAIATRTDPSRDVVIIPRAPADSLDHASFLPNLSGKMIIDATVKTREEGVVREWPEKIEMNEYEILKGKIEKYGF